MLCYIIINYVTCENHIHFPKFHASFLQKWNVKVVLVGICFRAHVSVLATRYLVNFVEFEVE